MDTPLYHLTQKDKDFMDLKAFSYDCAQFTLTQRIAGYEREFEINSKFASPGRLLNISLVLGDLYSLQAKEVSGKEQQECYSKAASWIAKGQSILQQVRSDYNEKSIEARVEQNPRDPTESGVFESVHSA